MAFTSTVGCADTVFRSCTATSECTLELVCTARSLPTGGACADAGSICSTPCDVDADCTAKNRGIHCAHDCVTDAGHCWGPAL